MFSHRKGKNDYRKSSDNSPPVERIWCMTKLRVPADNKPYVDKLLDHSISIFFPNKPGFYVSAGQVF